FSSRRRHTRSKRDWSSDVCSSDLVVDLAGHGGGELALGLGQTVAGQEDRVVEQAAGPRHRRGEGEHPEVDAVRAGLGGEGVALRSEERRVGKECRYRWRS